MAVRIASPNPVCCAACYAQGSGRHVDFEAATDGPIVVDEGGVARTWAGGTVSVDEIILCEACVRAAAELLAIEPTVMEAQAQELRDMAAQVELWRGRAAALRAAAAAWGEDLDGKAKAAPRKAPVMHGPIVRAAAVARVRGGETMVAVARELHVSPVTVANWVAAASDQSGAAGPGDASHVDADVPGVADEELAHA
jgi:hypothetical protein